MSTEAVANQYATELTEALRPLQDLALVPRSGRDSSITAAAERFASTPNRGTAAMLTEALPHAQDARWWSTPLGQVVGRTLATTERRWTYAQAAAWLGVTTKTVGGFVTRGKFSPSAGNGLLISEVVAYRDASPARERSA